MFHPKSFIPLSSKASRLPSVDYKLRCVSRDVRKVAASAIRIYYQLKGKPHVSVVIVLSYEAGVKELETTRQAFKYFHDNGITHLIIGIQSNGGGMIDFAQAFVQLFLPRSPVDSNNNNAISNDDDSRHYNRPTSPLNS
ncbi:hypothetical protein BGZ88_012771 [Linnemannia elongata]|nr:hypothetical protein BGZ88_012771 [Linnemannia elongata]